MSDYRAVIGLEVHVELDTKSKMFCSCSASYFGQEPNTHTCPVCLGLPGALPVPNQKAIEWCVMIGMALNCDIPLFAKFDRKNYFYPDLSKGYQISQYDEPFAINGWIDINCHPELVSGSRDSNLRQNDKGEKKRIRIRRVHMEEDTAKLIHQSGIQNSIRQLADKSQNDEGYSLIDFNRSGVPLVEIVTEPDFENAQEVKEYLQKLQQIVRYLRVSQADMEKGEMRLEPNISLRLCHPELVSGTNPQNNKMPKQVRHDKDQLPKYKVEVKNINSFRFVEKSINFEINRQRKILEEEKIPAQETRGWDEKKQITYSQRVKEEAMEYRYFPEPDIPPIRWTESQISNLKSQMKESPDKKRERFIKEYDLSEYNAEILTRDRETADFFEEASRVLREITNHQPPITSKQIADYIINKKMDINKTLPAEIVKQIISSSKIVAIDEKELEETINQVLLQNQKAVDDYRNGKVNVLQFIIGQVMRQVKKGVEVEIVKKILKRKIA